MTNALVLEHLAWGQHADKARKARGGVEAVSVREDHAGSVLDAFLEFDQCKARNRPGVEIAAAAASVHCLAELTRPELGLFAATRAMLQQESKALTRAVRSQIRVPAISSSRQVPHVGSMVMTNAVGAGVGLIVADKLGEDERKVIGWTLFLMGVVSTVPLVRDIFSKLR